MKTIVYVYMYIIVCMYVYISLSIYIHMYVYYLYNSIVYLIVCIYIYIDTHTCMFIITIITIIIDNNNNVPYSAGGRAGGRGRRLDPITTTPSPPIKSFDFRGFDSSRLSMLRGGNSHVHEL